MLGEWKIITNEKQQRRLQNVDNKSLNLENRTTKRLFWGKRNVKLKVKTTFRLPSVACMLEAFKIEFSFLLTWALTMQKRKVSIEASIIWTETFELNKSWVLKGSTTVSKLRPRLRSTDDPGSDEISRSFRGDRKWARFWIRRVSAATAMNYRRKKTTRLTKQEAKRRAETKSQIQKAWWLTKRDT